MGWYIMAILVAIATLILYWLASLNVNYWKEHGFPHVKSLPLFGNTLDVLLGRCTLIQAVQQVYLDLKGQSFGGYMQFITPILMVRDPELVNHIMIKDFSKFTDRRFPTDAENEPILLNLSSLKGATWRSLRHKLAPTFTSGKLKMMFNQLNECAEETVVHIRERGGIFEARTLAGKYTINVIGSVAFGLRIDAHNDNPENKRFLDLSTRFFRPSTLTMLKILFNLTVPKLALMLHLNRLVDNEVSEFFTKLVEDTIKHRKETGERRTDFLQLMLNIQDKESIEAKLLDEENKASPEDKELIEQLPEMAEPLNIDLTDEFVIANTFIFISGGSETTASALSFTLFRLAINPDIQEKLFNEINAAVNSTGFTYQTIYSVSYLDQVINEVLRLHSPAGFLDRICTEDFTIPDSDLVIKKGTTLCIPVFGLHNDPEYWEDAATFDPSRFDDTRKDEIRKGTYLPFGAGPRFCIAQRLALLKVKVLTAKLLLSYKVKLNSKTKLPLKLMPNSFLNFVVGGIWVEFIERN